MIITNWKMDTVGHKGLDCVVPCSMYSVLYENGLIPHPYYGTNEKGLTALSRNNTTFYTEVQIPDEICAREFVELTFEGLDTICDIFVNGTLIDSVENMHRAYTYDVKNLIKDKKLDLRLEFKSPLDYFEKWDKIHHTYTDTNCTQGAIHLRKALYMSGWDWAPTLSDMGIFRPVKIEGYDTDKINEVEILQHHENGEVTLSISAKTKKNRDLKITAEIDGQIVTLNDGLGEITIKNPTLWWANGLGKAHLYDIKFTLYDGDTAIDTLNKRIGLRTLYLSTEKDEIGSEFCFVLNGKKVFAMGANYVPMDNILPWMNNERISDLIDSCVFANFNCIRVWGGAFYPDDYFYDLCDENGLIIWQDFMVACANVWMRPEFENEFREEAIYNIKRIRHHASLGILCGNNEMEEAICGWPCADGQNPLVRSDYLKLYEDILPTLCVEYAPQTSYVPSSPTSGGNFDFPQDNTRGDVHFWEVWHGQGGFEEYRKHKFRFCSEYGFESLPSMKTIEKICPENERFLESETVSHHQKCIGGNEKILYHMEKQYNVPSDLSKIVHASQIAQASAIKYGVEHFRRIRGYCMGSVYWQLNDSWPVASWSSVDYYGTLKALHYFAKRFYAPQLVSIFVEDGKLAINAVNETLSSFDGKITLKFMKNDFTEIYKKDLDVSLKPLSSTDVIEMTLPDLNESEDYIFVTLTDKNGNTVSQNTELLTKPKFFKWQNPEIVAQAEACRDGVKLTLSAKSLALNVNISFDNIEPKLSDNFFNIATPNPYEIVVKCDLSPAEVLKQLQIITTNDLK